MRLDQLAFLVAVLLASPSLAAEDRPLVDFGKRISIEVGKVKLHVDNSKEGEQPSFLFGFDLRAGPLEDARQYLPFLEYLSAATGFEFSLRFTGKGASIIEDLGSGKIDFAAVGAVSFLKAHQAHGAISLVRGVNTSGKTEYQSALVVAPDSTIRSVEDLRGRRLGFGSASSTQGHLIPRILLLKHGLDLPDFETYEYFGSHQGCATAVVKRLVDACGMQDTLAAQFAREGLVRVMHMSDYYPSSGIAASPTVPIVAREQVMHALLAFEPTGRHAAGLYNWDRTEMPNGFQIANPQDYGELRDWAIQLGFMRADG